MDNCSEFGFHMTDSDIKYYDDGQNIIIKSKWEEIKPENNNIFKNLDYLKIFYNKIKLFINEKEINNIKSKIEKIDNYNKNILSKDLCLKILKLMDWKNLMDIVLEKEYKYNGDNLVSGIISNINKYL